LIEQRRATRYGFSIEDCTEIGRTKATIPGTFSNPRRRIVPDTDDMVSYQFWLDGEVGVLIPSPVDLLQGQIILKLLKQQHLAFGTGST